MQMVDRSQICLFDEFQKTHVNLSYLHLVFLRSERTEGTSLFIRISNFCCLSCSVKKISLTQECIKAGAVYFTYHGELFRDRWHFNCNHSI